VRDVMRVRAMLADFGRALTDKIFWLILTAGLLGAFEQSPFFILPLAILLTLFSVVSDEHWYQEFKARRLLPALWWFWLQCLAQNAGFVAAAFIAGHLTRWLWF
jgi:hypothetical protein